MKTTEYERNPRLFISTNQDSWLYCWLKMHAIELLRLTTQHLNLHLIFSSYRVWFEMVKRRKSVLNIRWIQISPWSMLQNSKFSIHKHKRIRLEYQRTANFLTTRREIFKITVSDTNLYFTAIWLQENEAFTIIILGC